MSGFQAMALMFNNPQPQLTLPALYVLGSRREH